MQFILYCLCGVAGVTLDFLVYYLLVEGGAWYQLANALGYLSGTVASFFLNRIITFSVKDEMLKRMLRFLSVAVVGFTVSAVMLYVLIEQIELGSNVSKALTLPVIVLIQFLLNRGFTFKSEVGAANTSTDVEEG